MNRKISEEICVENIDVAPVRNDISVKSLPSLVVT